MSIYEIKECYYCKTERRFFLRAGTYGAFFSCEKCRRIINITRNAKTAKKLFPEEYKEHKENSTSNDIVTQYIQLKF